MIQRDQEEQGMCDNPNCCCGGGYGQSAVPVPELFGANVFNYRVMKERLPKGTYKALRETILTGVALAPEVASGGANAMKDWAIERGASHYTHWFQPLTGTTAEKHDSFIAPTDEAA
jgi:glutamine synthetase